MSLPELIRKKRDGEALSTDDIASFVRCVVSGEAQDCQIGAMLMAIYLRDMNHDETAQLTSALLHSGEVLTWPAEWRDLLVDKHSTGGVGDKVSLPLAPALAACGFKVPMVSGRGLDHTGGTLDKLEAIPGFTVQLDHARMEKALREAGCFIAGQTDQLVPADRELYKRRDVTATVTSDPLIVASIISKKIAEGLRALILDVKVGAGVGRTEQRGRELARKLINTATALGVDTRAALTNMDAPIGRAVGNALEVAESVACLRGEGPEDLHELVVTFGGVLMHMRGLADSEQRGRELISEALNNGSALKHFETMLRCQGVEADTASELCHGNMWAVLPRVPPENIARITVPVTGFVAAVDALEIGRVCRELGAGRIRADQELDLRVGVLVLCAPGDRVVSGQPWLEVHHAEPELQLALRTRLEAALTVSELQQDVPRSRIVEIIH